MNARVLRKWSLTKFLVYLWLPVLMLLVIWSQYATTMHVSNSVSPSPKMATDNINQNDDRQLPFGHQNNNRKQTFMHSPIITNYNKQYDVLIKVENTTNIVELSSVPKVNSQVINLHTLPYSQYSGTANNNRNENISKRDHHFKSSPITSTHRQHKNIDKHFEKFATRLKLNPKNVESRIYERHKRLPSVVMFNKYNNRMNNRLLLSVKTITDNLNQNSIARISDTSNYKLLRQTQRQKQINLMSHRRRLIRLRQLSTNNYEDTIQLTTKTEKLPLNNDLNELMIGRNRRDSRSFSPTTNRQHRKRQKRYCSARDPTQLAFEAPTVFEGKVISMSYDRRANFSVTFEVKEIFKKQLGYILPHLLRLQFTYRNASGECDIYREYMKPRGLIKDDLEQGRVYILFVQQINSGNFTILGQPIRKTRRAVDAVKIGVNENYAQPATIKSLTASKTLVHNGEDLKIVCKVRGQPPPKVTWFKDDKSVNKNRRKYQFTHLKKRSELIVKNFNISDAGLYECRAKNKVFRRPEKKTIIIDAFSISTLSTGSTDESYSHSTGDECTGNFEQYCLNGGTCQYFREISVPSCECPDGYIGDRCQEKEWNNVTPNPTFKTGYMADEPLNSEEVSDDNKHGSDELLPLKDTPLVAG